MNKAKFSLGDAVVIISGEFKNVEAIVNSVIEPDQSNYNFRYKVVYWQGCMIKFCNFLELEVNECDIISLKEAKENNIDIIRYKPVISTLTDFDGDILNEYNIWNIEEEKMMEVKFKKNDFAVINSGKYKNVRCTILDMFKSADDNEILYRVSIPRSIMVLGNADMIIEIVNECELSSFDEISSGGVTVKLFYDGDSHSNSDNILVSNILSEDTMKSIAKDIFKDKITKYIDEKLNNRSTYGGITNYIVREICTEYIKTFIDKFKDDIDKEIYNEIHRKEVLVDSEGDDIPSFQEMLSCPLREIASDYIRNNSDEIVKSMINEINTAITKFTDNKLMDAVLSDLRNLYTKRIKDMLETTKEE